MGEFKYPLPQAESREKKSVNIGKLAEFDMAYFQQLEGEKGWIALDQDDYRNQKYFTVLSDAGEKLGIIGVYDTEDEKNISHTVVDPKYRRQGLAMKFKQKLMDELDIPFLTLTIDLDNTSSIGAAESIPGIRKVIDEKYEKDFHKVKYIYERPNDEK